MNESLLLGLWRYLLRLPPSLWRAEVQKNAERSDKHLAFMTAEHHQVRNFVVTELPRHARPLAPAYIAGQLGLPLESVQTILAELERNLTFLYRNPQGEVTWAYPVTVEPTPHHLTFSSGEQAYAAWAIDALAAPFVQGQLRSENLTFHIETRCGHCNQPLHLEVNSDLDVHVIEKEAEPLIFVPQVNFGRLQDPSIIDAFWSRSIFFWSEEHAKEHRRRAGGGRGTYMTLAQAVYVTPILQGALFAFSKEARFG